MKSQSSILENCPAKLLEDSCEIIDNDISLIMCKIIIVQSEITHTRIIMSGIITNFVGQIYADSGYFSVGRVGLKT